MEKANKIEQAYAVAVERYAEQGVNTDAVLDAMKKVIISLHCWQADDLHGFEGKDLTSGGGLQVTGNYPGRARSIDELRLDMEFAMTQLPGWQKISLHAMYGDFNEKRVDRNEIEVTHFQSWIDWAKELAIGLDFNATCFFHPKADAGYTLSSKDQGVRQFWIDHVVRCREIASSMGSQLGHTCVHNLWIPDGSKDTPMHRFTRRARLKDALDQIYSTNFDPGFLKDSVESKLFGIGSESMVVGSYDFYLGYALLNKLMITLDNGHFHPTEQVGDKISAVLQFLPEVLLHLTRGIRWDSDHVVTMNDEIMLIAQEVIRADVLERVHLGLDYFDASLNRIGAYVVGTRAVQKSFMYALLEPLDKLREYENQGNYFERLALLEESKTLPFGAVWDYYCLQSGVPAGTDYIDVIRQYETDVLAKR